MRISKIAATAMLGIAALGLSACATALNTQVSRYQQMPAPQGQTFVVVPGAGMATHSGLEFQRYAGIVTQQLAARGYRPATNPGAANMVVELSYDIDRGQVHYDLDPFTRSRLGSYGSPYGPYGGYGSYYYPRYGYARSPFYYGWNDPFWYGGVDSYVEYHSQLDLHIRQAGTNTPLFDGRAQARSATNRLDVVIPSLVEAMFTGFPGRSGENVRITIPNRKS